MNIEATLEDLEAQGYFQSIHQNNQVPINAKLIRIAFLDQEQTSMIISSPIQGKGFISGFNSSWQWILIPSRNIHSIIFLDMGRTIQKIGKTLSQLLNNSFLNSSMRIKFDSKQPEVFGPLVEVQKEWLRIGESLVSIKSLKSIAVEKLSELNRITRTLPDGNVDEKTQ